MQSYYGHVRTQLDALLLFEAGRLGAIPRIRRRLSEREKVQIASGCVYIWDEQEAGMRRWTDGKSWSASRVSGVFLTYREMEGNRRSSPVSEPEGSGDNSGSGSPNGRKRRRNATDDGSSDSADGFHYKEGGLYKQSFSLTTSNGLKLHLISYFTKEDVAAGKLTQPSNDPRLKDIHIPLDLYPDTPPGVAVVPAITTVPLLGGPIPSGPTFNPHGLPPYPHGIHHQQAQAQAQAQAHAHAHAQAQAHAHAQAQARAQAQAQAHAHAQAQAHAHAHAHSQEQPHLVHQHSMQSQVQHQAQHQMLAPAPAPSLSGSPARSPRQLSPRPAPAGSLSPPPSAASAPAPVPAPLKGYPSPRYDYRQGAPTSNSQAPVARAVPTTPPAENNSTSPPPAKKHIESFSEDQRVLRILDSALVI